MDFKQILRKDMNFIVLGHATGPVAGCFEHGNIPWSNELLDKISYYQLLNNGSPVLYTIRNARHTKSQVPDASILASFSWYTTEP